MSDLDQVGLFCKCKHELFLKRDEMDALLSDIPMIMVCGTCEQSMYLRRFGDSVASFFVTKVEGNSIKFDENPVSVIATSAIENQSD